MAARQPRARGQRPPWRRFERSGGRGDASGSGRPGRRGRPAQSCSSPAPRSGTNPPNSAPPCLPAPPETSPTRPTSPKGRQRARRSPSSRPHGPRRSAGLTTDSALLNSRPGVRPRSRQRSLRRVGRVAASAAHRAAAGPDEPGPPRPGQNHPSRPVQAPRLAHRPVAVLPVQGGDHLARRVAEDQRRGGVGGEADQPHRVGEVRPSAKIPSYVLPSASTAVTDVTHGAEIPEMLDVSRRSSSAWTGWATVSAGNARNEVEKDVLRCSSPANSHSVGPFHGFLAVLDVGPGLVAVHVLRHPDRLGAPPRIRAVPDVGQRQRRRMRKGVGRRRNGLVQLGDHLPGRVAEDDDGRVRSRDSPPPIVRTVGRLRARPCR